jgi:hypothetical protein
MGTTAFLLVILCMIPIVLVVVVIARADQRKATEEQELNQAHAAYQETLQALKAQPASADLRQRALELGRTYSNLTRGRQGVTVYDEMALMNDISAATANAVAGASSAEERLRKLGDLKAKGLITDQEYEAQRKQILSDL